PHREEQGFAGLFKSFDFKRTFALDFLSMFGNIFSSISVILSGISSDVKILCMVCLASGQLSFKMYQAR
ncbi:hypothetical protein, partial [Vibrio parahaemolyticus]|uniref:hypothetical protein n=1 Tax=Vibrio parahaemolyticus TaxID=670 RepID=UPI001A8E55E7